MDLVERLQPPSYTSQRGGLGWCNSRWVECCGDDTPVMWGLDHDIRIPMKQPGFNSCKARFSWLRWRWLVGFLLEKVCPGSSYEWSYYSRVGGWPTRLKNMLVKLDHLPRDPGENKKYLSCHHLALYKWPLKEIGNLGLPSPKNVKVLAPVSVDFRTWLEK